MYVLIHKTELCQDRKLISLLSNQTKTLNFKLKLLKERLILTKKIILVHENEHVGFVTMLKTWTNIRYFLIVRLIFPIKYDGFSHKTCSSALKRVNLPGNKMAGLYLHIPFCKSRCIYCGFYSSTQSSFRQVYVEALCRELVLRKDYIKGEPVETIYLGGGTPSQLTLPELQQIFSYIYKVYSVRDDAEITLEGNPDDMTMEYVRGLRSSLPVNRISMGVQTFDDKKLLFLRRRHTAAEARKAVENCQAAGFSNISIDLIYGLPGEDDTAWHRDVEEAISLQVPHLSAYCLMFEEGTPLYHLQQTGKVKEESDEQTLRFYTYLVERLRKAGYEHYEISNFCLPGYYSRHNSSYWSGKRYLGCGASAHSYDGESRQWNVASLTDYIKSINKGEIPCEKETLSLTERYNDMVVTRLRTMKGLSLSELERHFGKELYDYCLKNARLSLGDGNLEISGDYLRLTGKGIFISDDIMSDLLWVD